VGEKIETYLNICKRIARSFPAARRTLTGGHDRRVAPATPQRKKEVRMES
jgi:hypothetical protein